MATIALADVLRPGLGPARLYRTGDGQSWAPHAPCQRRRTSPWSALRAIPSGYLLIGNTFRGRPRTFSSADGEDLGARRRRRPGCSMPRRHRMARSSASRTQEIVATPDLVTWDQVGGRPPWRTLTMPAARCSTSVDWAGGRFAVSGMTFAGCPEGVDECYQRWLSTSPDGTTWTESTGPDGVAGT